jgi:hypothetical protein
MKNIRQEVTFDCGCRFVNGGAVALCERGRVEGGCLVHLDDLDLARERARMSVLELTEKDVRLLRAMKIEAP